MDRKGSGLLRRRGKIWVEISEPELFAIGRAAILLDKAYSSGVDFGDISEDVIELVENSMIFDASLSSYRDMRGIRE